MFIDVVGILLPVGWITDVLYQTSMHWTVAAALITVRENRVHELQYMW